MSILDRLRSRWGGGIRPDCAVSTTFIERWDGNGEGPAKCLSFEGFGFTASLFIGRTPAQHPKDQAE